MTAIVGVMNKHAVAIAADSAVTMGNTHKVVNSANKIFTLSKYHPIAVMTYNNASFMGTPWDIIIKEYRKNLGEQSFPTLREYVDDFLTFLHKRHFFTGEKTQHAFLTLLLDSFYNLCLAEIKQEFNLPDVSSITERHIEEKLTRCLNNNKDADRCPEFKTLSLDDFKNYSNEDIISYSKGISYKNPDLLLEAFFYYLVAQFSQPFYTGLVFVGYGEDEIYPSLYPINVVLGFDDKLKYKEDSGNIGIIHEHGPGAVIVPFAQTDVTLTILRGINPTFQDIISIVVDKSIQSYTKAITDILDGDPCTLAVSSAVKGLDRKSVIREITQNINREMFDCYTNPLLNTVVSLDKEDMAHMAESFIALTSLVRRMQPGEETVGGPVDVAVISKGDGFIWIKRKHYFNPELNTSFFSNYYK